ncbi:hypothetical protein [Mycetocola miduiensis]|uniref:hypothetical protein n=1 Tax=Mycetocola miduiensis TaxID=995034 RepID=UPI0011603F5B|nr:hypothetical protein [Mycetocola miduiensis]
MSGGLPRNCPFAPAATGSIGTEDLLYALERSRMDTGSIAAGELIDIAAWLSVELGSPVQSLLPKAGWFGPPDSLLSQARRVASVNKSRQPRRQPSSQSTGTEADNRTMD